MYFLLSAYYLQVQKREKMHRFFPATNSKKAVFLKVYIWAGYELCFEIFWFLCSIYSVRSVIRLYGERRIQLRNSCGKITRKLNRQWLNSEGTLNWNYYIYIFVGSSSVEFIADLSGSLFCRSQESSVRDLSNPHNVLSLSVVGLNLLRAFDTIDHVILSYKKDL